MELGKVRTGGIAWVLRVLALLAIALSAAIPPGFMPARAADNSIVVAICHGDGAGVRQIAMVLPDDGQGHRPDPGTRDPRENCPFAAHQAPQQLPELLPQPAPAVVYPRAVPAQRRAARVQPGLGLPAPPPPSRAPPSLTVV